MNNKAAKELLVELRSKLDIEQPLAKRIDEILAHKTYLELRQEMSNETKERLKAREALSREKFEFRKRQAEEKAQQQLFKRSQQIWPAPRSQEEADKQTQERKIHAIMISTLGANKTLADMTLKRCRAEGVEFTVKIAQEACGWGTTYVDNGKAPPPIKPHSKN